MNVMVNAMKISLRKIELYIKKKNFRDSLLIIRIFFKEGNMDLVPYSPTSSPSVLYTPGLCQSYYQTNPKNRSVIDHSVPGNRLVEHIDGALQVIPKTPAELAGEFILRPAIDLTWRALKGTFLVLSGSANSVDRAVQPLFNFPPGAKAVSINDEIGRIKKAKKGKTGKKVKEIKIRGIARNKVNRVFSPLKLGAKNLRTFLRDVEKEERKVWEQEMMPSYVQVDEMWDDEMLLYMQKNFDQACMIINDLSHLLSQSEHYYFDRVKAKEQSCKTYHNARWVLDHILNDLKRGEESRYSPHVSKNLVMNSTFSLRWEEHPLVSQELGFTRDCRSLEAMESCRMGLEELSMDFDFVKKLPYEQQRMLSEAEEFQKLYGEQAGDFMNEVNQVKITLPQWLLRKPKSKATIERLMLILEGYKTDLENGLKEIKILTEDIFKSEEGWQGRQLLPTIAEMHKRQQKIMKRGGEGYFSSVECVVEKTIDDFPVSWKFIKRGLFGETQLFSFTYECDAEGDLSIPCPLQEETATKLKEEL